MELKLTRRRFGQIAIATSATAALGYLAERTFAQTPLPILLARPNTKVGQVSVESLNLTSGLFEDVATSTLVSGETLFGFTALADGTSVLAIGATRGGKKENVSTRLVFLGADSKTLTVSGLKKRYRLESLLSTKDGSLYALAIKNNSTPPVELVAIDPSTGTVSLVNKIKLPADQRYINLFQSPDGKIFTTAVDKDGYTSLVELELVKSQPTTVAQFKLKDRLWNSGFSSLAFSAAGQLFALGKPRYAALNNLYVVNPSDGNMTLLKQDLADTKIATIPISV